MAKSLIWLSSRACLNRNSPKEIAKYIGTPSIETNIFVAYPTNIIDVLGNANQIQQAAKLYMVLLKCENGIPGSICFDLAVKCSNWLEVIQSLWLTTLSLRSLTYSWIYMLKLICWIRPYKFPLEALLNLEYRYPQLYTSRTVRLLKPLIGKIDDSVRDHIFTCLFLNQFHRVKIKDFPPTIWSDYQFSIIIQHCLPTDIKKLILYRHYFGNIEETDWKTALKRCPINAVCELLLKCNCLEIRMLGCLRLLKKRRTVINRICQYQPGLLQWLPLYFYKNLRLLLRGINHKYLNLPFWQLVFSNCSKCDVVACYKQLCRKNFNKYSLYNLVELKNLALKIHGSELNTQLKEIYNTYNGL